MCGRYSVLTEDEIIEIRKILQELSLRIVKDEFEQYDKEPCEICPTDHAPVIIRNNEGVSFESLKWGFTKWDGSGVIINARCETIETKSMFSTLTKAGRCVVPASEFFEWEKVGKKKKKHYAKDKDGNILFFAGLYRNTEDGREFVIITKEATGDMARIHDRLPVILCVNQIEPWLCGELTPEDISNLEFNVSVFPCNVDGGCEQLSFDFT